MSNVLSNTNFWDTDRAIELHLDSRAVFLYILLCPTRKYLDVYELKRHHASMCLGMNKDIIENAVNQLVEKKFIRVYGKYVQLLEGYRKMGGGFNDINANRELESLPVDVREYFYGSGVVTFEKPTPKKVVKKAGPKPETIEEIIAKQNIHIQEPLRDLVGDRIERKKAPTTRAVKGWISKLDKMYPKNYLKQADSINQTIERGWMGLFEVKDEFKKPGEGAFM